MSILLLGANGFLGSTMVGYFLQNGFDVIGVDKPDTLKAASSYLGDKNFSFEPVDVRDMEAIKPLLEEADIVIPLAAVVGYQACDKDPQTARDVNAASIQNIVKELSPHQMIIYPNTNSGYGVKEKKSLYTEEDPLDPNTEYGKTKMEGEDAVLSHSMGVSFRLASVFGVSPKMRWDLMAHDFIKKIADQPGDTSSIDLYEPEAMRNFVHVRDVARAFGHAVAYGLRGAYNLGLPSVSKLDLVQVITAKLGKSTTFIKPIEGTDPDKRDYLISGQKLAETGYAFAYPLRNGIKEVAYFYKNTELGKLCDVMPHGQN